ncbi:leucine-rich repeat domain-containing protein [Chaetoceros tenuissimus]|uniref:Leucine-rich repeat domain-containing protein n=1 Tax=Chaetoceros tenuissimus TaxID=426638 RepID=A0AAD3D5S8_9STRA|nr:leucine-rich repeat domain-containing protein [Chaetoceros tenuissimus]
MSLTKPGDNAVVVYFSRHDIRYMAPGARRVNIHNEQERQSWEVIWLFVEWVDPETFKNCKNLKKVVVMSQCVSILEKAFYGCSSLSEVTFDDLRQRCKLGDFVFYECPSLKEVTVYKWSNMKAFDERITKVIWAKYHGGGETVIR